MAHIKLTRTELLKLYKKFREHPGLDAMEIKRNLLGVVTFHPEMPNHHKKK